MVSALLLSFSSCLLFFANLDIVSSQNEYVRACYFTNWAQYRPDRGKYLPEDYIPGICTHILYAFVGMNEDFSLKAVEWNDIPVDGAGGGMYKRINALKLKDPGLKTLFSIGGWNFGTAKFKSMASTESNRKKFVANAVAWARKWGFDGIDIDWEYPDASDKANHAALMKELRAAAEEENSGPSRLLITVAVSPGQATIDAGYDGASLGSDLDFLFLMSYDYWGSWSSNIGCNSPLYGRRDMSANDKLLNTAWSAAHWADAGIPRGKIIIGIATYGRGWKLSQPTTGIPQNKGGAVPFPAKTYTREAGIAAYYEICDVVSSGGVRYWQDEQKVPYVIKGGTEWWGYDDTESITAKTKWIKSQGYGGAFVWTLDMDDFKGQCSSSNGQKYPLLNVIVKELAGERVPAVPAANPPTSYPYPAYPSSVYPTATYPPSAGSPTETLNPSSGGNGNTEKPPKSDSGSTCATNGFFPDPENCLKYIRCVSGAKYSFNCAPGTSFHSDTSQCDYIDLTKCAAKRLLRSISDRTNSSFSGI